MTYRKKRILVVGDGANNVLKENYFPFVNGQGDLSFSLISYKSVDDNVYDFLIELPSIKNRKKTTKESIEFFLVFCTKILLHARKFDIIHFHMFYPGILIVLPFLRARKILTLWGSDFLRASPMKKKILGLVIHKFDTITCTNPSLSDAVKSEYSRKDLAIRVLPYMLKYIGILERKELLSHSTENEVIIVVGSNSNKSQNHLKILNAIGESSLDKKHIHLILPMTYGRGGQDYINKIKTSLTDLNCSYEILERQLNDEELVDLRLRGDVFINLQDTDQLSGAMLEFLAVNKLVITGSWLDYSVLDEMGVSLLKIPSIGHLSKVLSNHDLRERILNREKILENYSPDAVKDKWLSLYE